MMEGVRYYKPLSAEQRLLISTLTTRFEGVEAPFILFEHEDYFELKFPPTIRRSAPWGGKASSAR